MIREIKECQDLHYSSSIEMSKDKLTTGTWNIFCMKSLGVS